MVGNTYPYSYNDWVNDIKLAQAAGFDGFALNFGSDDWQPARIADAYRAANDLKTNFKMLLSLDMSTFDCRSASRVGFFQNLINTYLPHPAAARYKNKALLSTFGGEWCNFGQSSVNAGWQLLMGSRRSSTYFMPAYTPGGGAASLSGFDIDAEVSWNSAWTNGGGELDSSMDLDWLKYLPNKYVATLSSEFFTHFWSKVCSRFGVCLR